MANSIVAEGHEIVGLDAIEKEVPEVVQRAEHLALKVVDQAGYESAASYLAEIKDAEKRVASMFDPVADKAHKAWKAVTTLRAKFTAPLETARKRLDGAMSRYFIAAETKRKAEDDRINAELRKQAEDAQLAAAATLEKAGDAQAAEQVLSAPTMAPVFTQPKTAAPDQSTAKLWYAEVTDVRAFCRGIYEGRTDTGLVIGIAKDKDSGILSSPQLNAMAKQQKDGMTIMGVTAKWKPSFRDNRVA